MCSLFSSTRSISKPPVDPNWRLARHRPFPDSLSSGVALRLRIPVPKIEVETGDCPSEKVLFKVVPRPDLNRDKRFRKPPPTGATEAEPAKKPQMPKNGADFWQI